VSGVSSMGDRPIFGCRSAELARCDEALRVASLAAYRCRSPIIDRAKSGTSDPRTVNDARHARRKYASDTSDRHDRRRNLPVRASRIDQRDMVYRGRRCGVMVSSNDWAV